MFYIKCSVNFAFLQSENIVDCFLTKSEEVKNNTEDESSAKKK